MFDGAHSHQRAGAGFTYLFLRISPSDNYNLISISYSFLDILPTYLPTNTEALDIRKLERLGRYGVYLDRKLERMLRSTNKVGRALLRSVCGEGRSVKEFETAAGWRPRYGIERLREAPDDVAECRGLITRELSR